VPVVQCPNGKWRIGSGPCMYPSKAAADRAYRGYLAAKHMSASLANMTTAQRKLFDYRLELAQEWFRYVEEAIYVGAPDFRAYAWDRFRNRYTKVNGRWSLRR